ncbi:glycosyl hydrolase [Bacteroidota bacterium]
MLRRNHILSLLILLLLISCHSSFDNVDYPYSSKPYTRWWWFARVLEKEDIKDQLDWVKEQGFGGVEIAFIYPVNRDPEMSRTEFLSEEWTEMVTYAKDYSMSIGLGCDFTFGSLWPFGGTFVSDNDRTKVFGNPDFRQNLRLSWSHPDTGNVLDHMSKKAFSNYAKIMGSALSPALGDNRSALFCDSWEVETRNIWTDGFDAVFLRKYDYDIKPFMKNILAKKRKGARYDYMKLVSEFVIDSFYIPFTEACHELGALSRAQCAGAPVDLIKAYSVIDIPESEAMLYNPDFSRIVASAAALSGKNIVSAESFTCIYGWPKEKMFQENIKDLKLVADALFANGVNDIIWHGLPFNPKGVDSIYFYASVHLGKTGFLSEHIKPFNEYLEKISSYMRQGKPYSDVAVYLPLEDAWIAGEYPDSLQLPWSWGAYEMRYIDFPEEVKAYHPLWVNSDFLDTAKMINEKLYCGDLSFNTLYIDVEYLDYKALKIIYRLAEQGLNVVMKNLPAQAGYSKDDKFVQILYDLFKQPYACSSFEMTAHNEPIIEAEIIPEYYCRETDEKLIIFISNPTSWNLKYPVKYKLSDESKEFPFSGNINWRGESYPFELVFQPNESILLEVDLNGIVKIELE